MYVNAWMLSLDAVTFQRFMFSLILITILGLLVYFKCS